jgi:hypothetical protein
LAVEGYFINKQNQLIEFNDKTFAALDDTCGFCDRNCVVLALL